MKARKRQHPLKVAKGLTIQGRLGKTWASGGRYRPSALCCVCRWSSEVAVGLNSKQRVVPCLSDWYLSTKHIIWDSGWLWPFSSRRIEKFLSIFFFLFWQAADMKWEWLQERNAFIVAEVCMQLSRLAEASWGRRSWWMSTRSFGGVKALFPPQLVQSSRETCQPMLSQSQSAECSAWHTTAVDSHGEGGAGTWPLCC